MKCVSCGLLGDDDILVAGCVVCADLICLECSRATLSTNTDYEPRVCGNVLCDDCICVGCGGVIIGTPSGCADCGNSVCGNCMFRLADGLVLCDVCGASCPLCGHEAGVKDFTECRSPGCDATICSVCQGTGFCPQHVEEDTPATTCVACGACLPTVAALNIDDPSLCIRCNLVVTEEGNEEGDEIKRRVADAMGCLTAYEPDFDWGGFVATPPLSNERSPDQRTLGFEQGVLCLF